MPVDYRDYVYTPADLATIHVEYAKRIKADPGVPFGVPGVDKRVIPARGGNLIGIVGRPGAGKSSIMSRWAKVAAMDLVDAGMDHKYCVPYISLEQNVEELSAYFASGKGYTSSDYAWGRIPMQQVEQRAPELLKLPIWIIGHSSKRVGKKLPPLTPEVMYEAIRSMDRDYNGVYPRIIFIDYLQIVPSSRHYPSRTDQVNEVIRDLKGLSIATDIPIVMGVQASREVDTRKDKIPAKADCQHASAIEQDVDKLFAIWRPWTTEPHGCDIKVDVGEDKKLAIPNSPELFFLKMLKQRNEDGSHLWIMRFTPQELELAEMELDQEEPTFKF
jgi:replicative DNA helicase